MKHAITIFLFLSFQHIFTLEYSRITMDSIVVSDGKTSYFEELDSYNRPFESSVWNNGALTKKTTWFYEGSNKHPYKKIQTTDTSTIVTEYDENGNEIISKTSNVEGEVLQTITTKWTQNNVILSSEIVDSKETVRTEYFYDKENNIIEKKLYKNGLIQVVYSYPSENETYESLYKDEKLLVVIYYRDGERIRETDAKNK